jgi:FCD domain
MTPMELFSSSLDKAANALEALNASMGVALQNDDLLAWAKADDEFRRLLVVSCGNRRIARIAETIMHQSHRARMLTLKLWLEMGPLGNIGYAQQTDRLSAECESKRLPSPVSSSGRPSRTYVERKTLASGIFSGVHVNHLYGLWLGSRNERIVVQQQNRFDYPHELTARHRFWHRDRYGQGIRVKAAILDQDITRQLFVFLKDRVNAGIDCLK